MVRLGKQTKCKNQQVNPEKYLTNDRNGRVNDEALRTSALVQKCLEADQKDPN